MWLQFLLVSCLSVLGLAASTYRCPASVLGHSKYVKVFEQNCYEFVVHKPSNFSDAQNYCKEYGGNLAMIKNTYINNFIGNTLEKTYNIHNQSVWIGLQYSPQHQSFIWMDGSELSTSQNQQFLKQTPKENQNCVSYIPNKKLWRNSVCETNLLLEPREYSRKIFICQYQAILVNSTALPNRGKLTVDDCPRNISRDRYLQVYGTKCYLFHVNDVKTFHKADAECQLFGGRLVTVDSEDVDTYIQNELYNKYGYLKIPVWIGLRYSSVHGTFVWLDGSRRQLSNFRYDSHKLSEKCVGFSAYDGKWLTLKCASILLPYVCEFEPQISATESPTKPPSKATTCPSITCELLCGMEGYKKDPNGCLKCECDL